MEMQMEGERETRKVVRRERLHGRSSAVDGREGEEERVEGVWVRKRGVGAAVGGGWQAGEEEAARYTTTDVEVERDSSELVEVWGKAMTFGGRAPKESQRVNGTAKAECWELPVAVADNNTPNQSGYGYGWLWLIMLPRYWTLAE
jgi:hypothetical protein